MPSHPLPPDETARLAALDSYGILDTPPAPAFNDLVTLAAEMARMSTWEWRREAGELASSRIVRDLSGASDAVGTVERFVGQIHVGDRERVRVALAAAAAGEAPFDLEFRFPGPDGSWRWLSSRGCLLPGESTAKDRVVGVTMDVTDRRVAAGRWAHSLRGAAANLGAERLAALCGELELAGRAGDLLTASTLAARLDDEASRVRSALEEACHPAE